MDEESVALTRRYGTVISAVSVMMGLLYLLGLARRSYWALALPVSIATIGALGASLLIGRTLMTTPDERGDL
ncbi:MAG: hypothetical protein ACREN5_04865 [Gemmatimonadales bacterium]